MPADLTAFPAWANAIVVLAGAAVIWWSGTRLAHIVDAIADRTGIGRAFAGALLLGGVTSLPELGTMVSAAMIGNAPLAANNLFGSVSTNLAILAVADVFVRGRAMPALIDPTELEWHAWLVTFLLCIATIGIVVGEPAGLPVGPWSLVLFVLAVAAFWLLRRGGGEAPEPGQPDEGGRERDTSVKGLVAKMAAFALVVLVAGFVVARAADAVATQTGLGGSFVGFTLLAFATSVPEMSTTFALVRLGRPAMATANVFGTNLFNHLLLFPTDLAYTQGALFEELGDPSVVAAVLGIALGAAYAGSRGRGPLLIANRLSVPAALTLVLYVVGVALLYAVR